MSYSEKMDIGWQHLGHEEKFKYLLRTGHLADVSFVVGEAPDDLKTFTCHKWVLTCASPVFERMFHGDFKESNSSVISLDDTNPTDFDHFLEFIYCNNKEVLKSYSLDCLKGLLTLGDRYMVETVKAAAIATIEGKIRNCDFGELVTIFEYGQLFSEPKLIDQAVNMITSRIQSVGTSFITGCARIYDLDAQTFHKFLKLPISISQRTRFDLIEAYIKVNGLQAAGAENTPTQVNPNQSAIVSNAAKENNQPKTGDDTSQAVGHSVARKSDIVEMLLVLVNFENMSAKEFCSGPVKSQLLDTAKKLEIIVNICSK